MLDHSSSYIDEMLNIKEGRSGNTYRATEHRATWSDSRQQFSGICGLGYGSPLAFTITSDDTTYLH